MIALLLDHLWQSTLFAAVAGALTLTLRNNGARWRYGLWLAASGKFLIPFSLLVGLGAHVFHPVVPEIYAPASVSIMRQAAQPFSISEPVLTVHESGMDWLPLLAALWVAGTGAVVFVWFRRWRRIAVALRDATPLAIKSKLPVMVSPSFLEPGLVGIWRPVLLLPQGIAGHLSEQEMAAILAHELCHWRRRDNLTSTIQMLVQALFWFHPLVWWMGVKLVEERERACDEEVLESGNDPQTYAEGILKVCKFYLQSGLVCASGLSGADLRSRVETIMGYRRSARVTAAKKFLLAAVAITVVATPVAAGMIIGPAKILQIPGTDALAKTRAEQARPRTAIIFDPAKFDKYVGTYQGDTIITVWREGAHLYTRRTLGVNATRLTPKPRIEVYPESENKFFARDVVAQYSFVTDAMGNATTLIFHQSGIERPFKKISASAAQAIEASLVQRIQNNESSPGTQGALRRYLVSIQEGRPNYDELAPGIAARTRPGLKGARALLLSQYGAFKSLTFKGVGQDGMDIYTVSFAKGQADWWIAPLTADGKIVWVGGDIAAHE